MVQALRTGLGWRLFVTVKRTLLFALLWLVLTSADPKGFGFGLVAVAAATWLSLVLLPAAGRQLSLVMILPLVPGFVWRTVRGGIDVAWRALHPRLPIRPGWYVHRTALTSGAKVALGSVVSLLPGTLVAGSTGDRLYVHCLDLDADIAGQVAAEEARIASTLGPSAGGPGDAA